MRSKTTIFITFFTVMIMLITVLPGLCEDEKQPCGKKNAIYTNPEKIIQCKVGITFLIILDSNPTTGHKWQLANFSDGEPLKLISSKYRASKIDLEGAGGKEIWSFKALSAGQRTIVFEYVRLWEKDKEPIKIVTFTVNIQ